MPVKIKKQYKNPDGTITEVEGTEAEIEAYEKKQNKKNETVEKKKGMLYGKKLNEEQVREIVRDEMSKSQQNTKEVHHWHYYNGWWWRPFWDYGVGTYKFSYTNTDPNTSTYTIGNVSTNTADSILDLSAKTGIGFANIVDNTAQEFTTTSQFIGYNTTGNSTKLLLDNDNSRWVGGNTIDNTTWIAKVN